MRLYPPTVIVSIKLIIIIIIIIRCGLEFSIEILERINEKSRKSSIVTRRDSLPIAGHLPISRVVLHFVHARLACDYAASWNRSSIVSYRLWKRADWLNGDKKKREKEITRISRLLMILALPECARECIDIREMVEGDRKDQFNVNNYY